jgi:hypothetical protein
MRPARSPTPRTPKGGFVTFADAAEAWLLHGERKRNLKRSTLRDYRQALDTYLLPAPEDSKSSETRYGPAPFALTPLRDLDSKQLKAWYEDLPYGRTTEKLLMIRKSNPHPRARTWVDRSGPVCHPRAPTGAL